MYFAALLARTEDGWEASDTELDNVESLSDLTDLAREAAAEINESYDETVLVFIEQEGAWFGVVRIDGEEDPRIFISNGAAASRSAYGEILLTDEMLGRDPDGGPDVLEALDLDGTEDGESEAADVGPDGTDAATAGDAVPAGPLGDKGILRDLGVPEKDLLGLKSGDALSEIADILGAAEVLETVR